MTIYIGLDVHSKLTVYAAQNQEGRVIAQGQVPTTPAGVDHLIATIAAPPDTPVALESGTQSLWLSRLLAERRMRPVVVNAREVRAKSRNKRQKTDRRDAFEICDGLRRDQWVSIVWQPPAPIEALRQVLSRRRHFVRIATAQTNAAKFLLRRRGQAGLARCLVSDAAWRAMIARPELADAADHLALHFALWRQAKATVAKLDGELAVAARPLEATMELLQTMTGVGPIVAATFIATLGDPGRFDDAARVVGYIGLAVSTYDSGDTERHGSITKSGSPALRSVLCEAAHHAARPAHPLYPYYARLAARRGVKPAVVAVAQRMARILWQMWRHNKPFDLGRLNVESVRKIKSRTIHWEIRPAGATASAAR